MAKKEKTWEQKMLDIKWPEVGKGKKFLVQCDGKAFAGFDTRKEAEQAKEMYARNVKGGQGTSANSKMTWAVVEQ